MTLFLVLADEPVVDFRIATIGGAAMPYFVSSMRRQARPFDRLARPRDSIAHAPLEDGIIKYATP